MNSYSLSKIWGLFFVLAGLVGSGCGDNPVRFYGRLAFRDVSGCNSPVGGSQSVPWSTCNTFKRNFNRSSGVPFRENFQDRSVLRPLPATVKLEVFYAQGVESALTFVSCGHGTLVTDMDGIFNSKIYLKDDDERCMPGANNLIVIGTVSLQYRMVSDDQTRSGTIRALWQEEQAYPLLAEERFISDFSTGDFGYEAESPTGPVRIAVPELAFYVNRISIPEISGDQVAAVNLNTRTFLNETGQDRYGYLRQLLTGYSNVVNLHHEARTILGNNRDYYDKMFVTPPPGTSGWGKTYSIFFDNTWAFGWRGGMAVVRPDVALFREDGNGDGSPDGSWGAAWLLSDTSVLSHEFGHSLQGAYVTGINGFGNDYDFAGMMMRPSGYEYSWGHGGWQHAQMGAAMNEGFANSYGQYLLNRCNNWNASARPIAVDVPFAGGVWGQDRSCDGVDNCGYHHTRWHLRSQRGLGEDSAELLARSARVQALTSAFIATGGTAVNSNNEARNGEFGCDLLDADNSVTHASAVNTSYRYTPDFTYWVAEYLNGSTAAVPAARAYSAAAAPENVQLTLAQLLEAYGTYCTDCTSSLSWNYFDGYNQDQLSISGPIAPQSLGRYLVGRGWATSADINNVLRTNLMEEMP